MNKQSCAWHQEVQMQKGFNLNPKRKLELVNSLRTADPPTLGFADPPAGRNIVLGLGFRD